MKYLFLLLFLFSTASATLNNVDKASIWSKQILTNGGFENGKTSWSVSGGDTFATATSGSNLLEGAVSITWDSAGAGRNLDSTAVTIPKGYYGRNGVASCVFLTPSGTATHTINAYDGSSVLASTTITSSTTPVRSSINFIMPSSGSIQLRVASVASDEPSITIDSCFVGPAEGFNLSSVSQAALVGESYFAGTTNCTGWTTTSSTLGALASDSDCPGPTVVRSYLGSWQTTDANLPIQTINNLPSGSYVATFIVHQSQTGGQFAGFAINDGTTTCQGQGGNNDSNAGTITVSCSFEYTTTGNRAFQLYAAITGGSTLTIQNGNTAPNISLKFLLVRYPLTTELAYTPDVVANSWSGYHDNTCVWVRTNTAIGDFTDDASCALVEVSNRNFGTVSTSGSVSPAITFTPRRAQKYYVKAAFQLTGSNAGQTQSVRLTDGTTTIADGQDIATATVKYMTLSGIVTASSTSAITLKLQGAVSASNITVGASTSVPRSSIEWTIFAIDQTIPAPLLVNSVVASYSGVTRTISGNLNCDASSTINSQLGTGFASIGNISTGACAVTFTAGTFSATPVCSGNATACNGGCVIGFTSRSSSGVSLNCMTDTGSAGTSCDADIKCEGPK